MKARRSLAASLLLLSALVVHPRAGAQGAGTAGATAAVQRRTDSLSDSGFAALVARLSERGGSFDTDNLISNERSYLHALSWFDRTGVRGGAFIGVGPDQSYSYIARVRPRIAYMIDIRRDNLLHHLLLKALFARARNRAEYLALWLGRPVPADVGAWATRDLESLVAWAERTPATPASSASALAAVRGALAETRVPLSASDLATIERFHRTFIADGIRLRFTTTGRAPRDYYPTLGELLLERDLGGANGNYLAREADFQFLKGMHRRNLIVPVVGDLAGPHALAAIGADIRARGERVSVLYVSNVEDYLIRDGRFPTYVATVSALPRDRRSLMVRSLFADRHPANIPTYHSTQLAQTLESFATDPGVRGVTTYRALAARRYLPVR